MLVMSNMRFNFNLRAVIKTGLVAGKVQDAN